MHVGVLPVPDIVHPGQFGPDEAVVAAGLAVEEDPQGPLRGGFLRGKMGRRHEERGEAERDQAHAEMLQ
jgi:hypothetical protein